MKKAPAPYQPLVGELRAFIPTDEAAWHLGRTPQTLREWSSRREGPISPVRVGRRLAWRVADIRRVLGV